MPARAHLPVSAYFPGHGTASALPYTDPDGSFMSADNLIGGRWLFREISICDIFHADLPLQGFQVSFLLYSI